MGNQWDLVELVWKLVIVSFWVVFPNEKLWKLVKLAYKMTNIQSIWMENQLKLVKRMRKWETFHSLLQKNGQNWQILSWNLVWNGLKMAPTGQFSLQIGWKCRTLWKWLKNRLISSSETRLESINRWLADERMDGSDWANQKTPPEKMAANLKTLKWIITRI